MIGVRRKEARGSVAMATRSIFRAWSDDGRFTTAGSRGPIPGAAVRSEPKPSPSLLSVMSAGSRCNRAGPIVANVPFQAHGARTPTEDRGGEAGAAFDASERARAITPPDGQEQNDTHCRRLMSSLEPTVHRPERGSKSMRQVVSWLRRERTIGRSLAARVPHPEALSGSRISSLVARALELIARLAGEAQVLFNGLAWLARGHEIGCRYGTNDPIS